MHRSRFGKAALFLTLGLALDLSVPSRVRGTSYPDYSQLAGLRDFSVSVDVRQKGKQPLRSIRDTQYLLSNAIVDTLRAGGLRFEDTSPLGLVFIVEYSYNPDETEWVALSVRLQLYEQSHPTRPPSKAKNPRTHRVVSWSWHEVDLVPAARASETMVSRAKGAAENFVGAVKLANEIRAGLR